MKTREIWKKKKKEGRQENELKKRQLVRQFGEVLPKGEGQMGLEKELEERGFGIRKGNGWKQ